MEPMVALWLDFVGAGLIGSGIGLLFKRPIFGAATGMATMFGAMTVFYLLSAQADAQHCEDFLEHGTAQRVTSWTKPPILRIDDHCRR